MVKYLAVGLAGYSILATVMSVRDLAARSKIPGPVKMKYEAHWNILRNLGIDVVAESKASKSAKLGENDARDFLVNHGLLDASSPSPCKNKSVENQPQSVSYHFRGLASAFVLAGIALFRPFFHVTIIDRSNDGNI